MIDILIAYDVNTRPSELIRSTASVDVFSAANVSVNSFPEFSHEVARVNARLKLSKAHFGNTSATTMICRFHIGQRSPSNFRTEDCLHRVSEHLHISSYGDNFAKYPSGVHELKKER